jgi:hypothetical protein
VDDAGGLLARDVRACRTALSTPPVSSHAEAIFVRA